MDNYLPTPYQTFIATSRYSRWLEDKGRRETWGETVKRYVDNITPDGFDHETTYHKEYANKEKSNEV